MVAAAQAARFHLLAGRPRSPWEQPRSLSRRSERRKTGACPGRVITLRCQKIGDCPELLSWQPAHYPSAGGLTRPGNTGLTAEPPVG